MGLNPPRQVDPQGRIMKYMAWLSTADSLASVTSGLILVLGGLYKGIQIRRQSAYFSLDSKAPVGEPIQLVFTNSGRRTVYRAVGTISFMSQHQLLSQQRFTAVRLAEGESTPIPIPLSGRGAHAMRFDELSGIADVIAITVRYRNGPRSPFTWKQTVRFGSVLFAQDKSILFDGRVIGP